MTILNIPTYIEESIIVDKSINSLNNPQNLVKAIELDNSSLFDVHRWSDYPEINNAVEVIYNQLKSVAGFGINSSTRKRHLKVIILDLYVKWLVDPQMYCSYYRADWYYRDLDSRYNKLFISRITPRVVDALESLKYLISINGYYNRQTGKSRISRMRATQKLIDLIVVDFKITPEMIEVAPNTECVVMRNWSVEKQKQIDIPYDDNAHPDIGRWRQELVDYNNLLRATYIDIPSFPHNGLVVNPTTTKRTKHEKLLQPRKILINHYEKFVRRIFSNNDWEQGGRFYGGWWQRVPSEWRKRIRIGNMPVSEIDFKGLHIVILYLILGMEYQEDPYLLEGFEKSGRMRDLLKQILLCSINAKDKTAAVNAIRKEINFNPEEYYWIAEIGLDISAIIDAFVAKHKAIGEYFFSNSGVKLQNIDSRIAEIVINHFTQLDIPVLCIHDSFVISADRAEDLLALMTGAYLTVAQELDLPCNKNPRTNQSGLEVGQWAIIQSNADWRDLQNAILRESYDYPIWYKNLKKFQKREFQDYFHV